MAPLILDLTGIRRVGVSLESKVVEADAGNGVRVKRCRSGTVGVALVRIQVVKNDRILIQLVYKQLVLLVLQIYGAVIHHITLTVELDVDGALRCSEESTGTGGGSIRISAVYSKLTNTGRTGYQLTIHKHGVNGVASNG